MPSPYAEKTKSISGKVGTGLAGAGDVASNVGDIIGTATEAKPEGMGDGQHISNQVGSGLESGGKIADTVGDTLSKVLPSKYGDKAKKYSDLAKTGMEAGSALSKGIGSIFGAFGKDMVEMDRTPFYE